MPASLLLSRASALQSQDLPYRVIEIAKRGGGEGEEGEKEGHACTAAFYLKDCIRGLKEDVGEKSVDVVVTSPPYNIGVSYGSYRDDMPHEKYLSWIEEVGMAVKRVLADGGSFFLNVGNRPKDQWIAWDVASALRKHFVLQNTIHWVKSIAIPKADAGNYQAIAGDIAVGHFKPVASSRFLNDCHEYIFHFTARGDVSLDKLAVGIPYQDKTNIGRWKAATQDRRDRGNTWFIPYETIQSKSDRPHPATFPVKLPEMCIKLHGGMAMAGTREPGKKKGRQDGALLVVDPFTGIGSTAVACKRLGVSFVGFEISKEYLDTAIARLED